ncbi:MAG: DUF2791 family P-loop domain-containing protein [Anaerolineales bacterium]|nr:DUF2791 family P-loop domain-containing protein [Anaerolineales bacterium]
MDIAEAQRVLEDLRQGIPPDGYIRHFTVGRKTEIDKLDELFKSGRPIALLIKANYGTGKTHLLRYIREIALEEGFAVSLITLDAKSAIRFNRMDQIFGAVIRNVEIPGYSGKGPSTLFEALYHTLNSSIRDTKRLKLLNELHNYGKWDQTTLLASPSLFIAIRAWITGKDHQEDCKIFPQEVEGWISEPWVYYTQTNMLLNKFIRRGRLYFRDPRLVYGPAPGRIATFDFRAYDYQQAWDGLKDLDTISKLLGFKGMVLLVDEFEDVIYNLRKGRKDPQIDAFYNLFSLFKGRYPGYSFYAVTPDFTQTCKRLLLDKGYYDFDYSRFDQLATFEMSPLGLNDLKLLADRIIEVYTIAYHQNPVEDNIIKIDHLLEELDPRPIEDKTRLAIRRIVRCLDDFYYEETG